MDNFWILIVIIGAVISLSQKSQKKAATESEDTTQPNPQEEWERQLREILGEKGPHTPPQPIPSATVKRVNTSKTRHITQPKRLEQDIHSTSDNTKRIANIPLYSPKASLEVQTLRESAHNNTTSPQISAINSTKSTEAVNGPKSDIDKIIEDFSMEKAVIYAEIIKPKYEEY